MNYGLKNINEIQECVGMWIYPNDYFNPINIITLRLHITNNTRSIHHFAGSWKETSYKRKIIKKIRSIFPEKILLKYNKLKNHKNRV